MANENENDGKKPRSALWDAKTQSNAPSISLAPRNFEELWRFAELICRTNFVPDAFKANPGAVIAACQYGNEVGLKPMTSLQWIAIINGRPSIWGDGALMLVRSHPHFEFHKELSSEEALAKGHGECTIKAKGEEAKTRRFTKEMAETAHLWGGKGGDAAKKAQSTWAMYPGRMLQMRARSLAMRDAIPEALGGLSIREESEDMEPRDITPEPEPTEQLAPMRQSEHDEQEEATGSQAQPTATEEPQSTAMTEEHRKTLADAFVESRVTSDDLRRHLHKNYGLGETADIPDEYFEDLVDWIRSQPKPKKVKEDEKKGQMGLTEDGV